MPLSALVPMCVSRYGQAAAETDDPSVGSRLTAVAPGEDPAEGAEDWTLAQAVVGATALDCSHDLHEMTDDSEEQVDRGQ